MGGTVPDGPGTGQPRGLDGGRRAGAVARFPVFPDPLPKTFEEVEEQVHDMRLVGLTLLLIGFTLLASGITAAAAVGTPEVGLIGAGGALIIPALALLLAAPPIVRARWHRRMGGRRAHMR